MSNDLRPDELSPQNSLPGVFVVVAAQHQRVPLSFDSHHGGLTLVPPRPRAAESGNGRGSLGPNSVGMARPHRHRRLEDVGRSLFRRQRRSGFFCDDILSAPPEKIGKRPAAGFQARFPSLRLRGGRDFSVAVVARSGVEMLLLQRGGTQTRIL